MHRGINPPLSCIINNAIPLELLGPDLSDTRVANVADSIQPPSFHPKLLNLLDQSHLALRFVHLSVYPVSIRDLLATH